MIHRVYLVPGFFGFANFGELSYFAHVRARLIAAFADRNTTVAIQQTTSLPTASLPRRTAWLAKFIADTAGDDRGPIHIIGHSTGGIDARLLLSPGVSLPDVADVESIAARVRTVVTVASPHAGAPLAAFFNSVLGQQLLRALSITTLHGIRLGSVPLPALLAIAGALPGAGPFKRPALGMLNQVYRQLLKDFDAERRRDLEQFFTDAGADQALLPQLSPDGMDLFNTTTRARDGVRYGCVLARANPPRWSTQARIGLAPANQTTYALYRALHRLAGPLPERAVPRATPAQRAAVIASYGTWPTPADNDAIVPTLSQLHGDVVHAARGDHLDVIGHFNDLSTSPPHVDWLCTRSRFDAARYDAMWTAVSDYLLAPLDEAPGAGATTT